MKYRTSHSGIPRRLKTARCVLTRQLEVNGEAQFLLAVHSSFWGRRERRWGLAGGRIEWREDPAETVRRELREELYLHLDDLIEVGVFGYKGSNHAVFGARTDASVADYDKTELLDVRWFNHHDVAALNDQGKLHAGYELEAIQEYLDLSGRDPII